MKSFTYVLSLLLLCFSGYSQIDNKQEAIKRYANPTERDTSFVNEVISNALDNRLNTDILTMLYEALDVAIEEKYHKGIAKCYNTLGVINTSLGNLVEARNNYQQLISIYEDRKDYENLAKIYCDLAQVYRKQGDLDIALEKQLIAIKIDKNHALSTKTRIIIFRNCAGMYRLKQDFKNALKYMQNALELSIEENFLEDQGHNYSSLGNIYLDIKNYEEARKNYDLSISIFEQNADTLNIANGLNNISQFYLRIGDLEKADSTSKKALGLCLAADLKAEQVAAYRGLGIIAKTREKYDESLEHHLKSLSIAEEIQDRRSILMAYQNLGTVYGEQGDFNKSLEYFELSKNEAVSTKDTVLLRIIYNNLSFVNKLIGDYKAAYNYHLDFYNIEKKGMDKIQKAASQASLMKTKIYEKEKEMKEKEVKQMKLNNKYLSTIIVLSLLLLFASIFAIIKIRKLNFKLKNKNDQLIFLNKEMHHRVKNNLQAISSFIYLNYKKIKNQELRNVLTSIRSQIVSIGQIHKLLYQGEKDMKIDALNFFASLTKEITNLQIDKKKSIQVEKTIQLNKFSINFDKAVQIGLIINELITNAFKYAFENNPNPILKIHIETIKNESLYILIKDNGPGIKSHDRNKQNFGLDLIESLVQQDQWEFSRSTDEGCAYTLIVPLREIVKKVS